MDALMIYLFSVNALSLTLMLVDKHKAKTNAWRIPEATLLTVAALGGSLGAFLGMRIARHKTRHPKFSIGLPVLMALHIAIACIFITKP